MKSSPTVLKFLPPANYTSEDQQRLADTIESDLTRLMSKIDAAIRFRTAGNDAQRHRRYALRSLEEAAIHTMNAMAYTVATDEQKESRNGR